MQTLPPTRTLECRSSMPCACATPAGSASDKASAPAHTNAVLMAPTPCLRSRPLYVSRSVFRRAASPRRRRRRDFSARRSFCVTVRARSEFEGKASLPGGDDGDLHEQARIGELGFDAGAAWQVLAARPGVPGLVHGVAQANVGNPDGGGYDLGLVGAAQLEETIDLLEHLLRLPLHVLRGIAGRDAGGEHEAVGLDDFGVDLRRLVPLDGHGAFLPGAWLVQPAPLVARSRVRAIS